MGERAKGKEVIGRGELFFLSHPGKEEIFSGYGLAVEEGSEESLVGILMVDRPRPVDQKWLKQVERNFGEYQLVPMTATGERGIVCRMNIEKESIMHLCQFSTEKADAIKKVFAPLLENLPQPAFLLRWNDEKHLWQSRFANRDDWPHE
jgi:hypothetical protein